MDVDVTKLVLAGIGWIDAQPPNLVIAYALSIYPARLAALSLVEWVRFAEPLGGRMVLAATGLAACVGVALAPFFVAAWERCLLSILT